MNDCPCGGNCACGAVPDVLVQRYGAEKALAYTMSEAYAKFGHVQANNIEDPESEQSILLGWVGGEGLLGDAAADGFELEEQAGYDGYYAGGDSPYAESRRKAATDFYDAIKALEAAIVDMVTPHSAANTLAVNSEK